MPKRKQVKPPTKPPTLAYEPVPLLTNAGFTRQQFATLTMLAVGIVLCVALWLAQDTTAAPWLAMTHGWGRWLIVLAMAVVCVVPPIARQLVEFGERVSRPSPKTRAATAWLVGFVAFCYLAATAHLQGRDLFPKTHDDQSYLLQMQMLAHGRLWMPQHPLADFFDTFYVLVRPVYASLYFPGASLLYVPTIWLGLPAWVMPAMVAGAIVGLVYRIVTELIDSTAGLLAALAMISLEWFRVYSMLLTSHEPMLLMGLLLTWSWLRWRASQRWRPAWAALMGVFAGWGAITRPADALCFAIPIGIAVLLDVLKPKRTAARDTGVSPVPEAPNPAGTPESVGRQRSSEAERREHGRDARVTGAPAERSPFRGILITVCLVVVGAAPFLAVQAVFNRGVTGSVWETPYAHYLKQDQPNTSFGFHPYDPLARPMSVVPQKQAYYQSFFLPYVLRHQPSQVLPWWGRVYAGQAVDTSLPARPLLAFLPVGLLALHGRGRKVLAASVSLFVLLYMGNTFFLEHYAILIAPAMLMLALLGIRRMAHAAGPRWAARVRVSLSAAFVAVCLLSLPESDPLFGETYDDNDETFVAPLMQAVRNDVPALPESKLRRPAVFLFRWGPGQNIQEEPVYNTGVMSPDDAPILFAHDLGDERNREVFRYYADRQPNRFFYRWDRTTGLVEDLGYARDLVKPDGR